MCNISVSCDWDGHCQSVGRSVEPCVPVDHASVGLAQVHPNTQFKTNFHLVDSYILHIRESVDSLCRDGADAQYMQYLSKSRITSTQIR